MSKLYSVLGGLGGNKGMDVDQGRKRVFGDLWSRGVQNRIIREQDNRRVSEQGNKGVGEQGFRGIKGKVWKKLEVRNNRNGKGKRTLKSLYRCIQYKEKWTEGIIWGKLVKVQGT